MPKLTLSPSLVTNAGIAAAARTHLEFTIAPGGQECRFSYGTTYTAADSQVLRPGDVRIFAGTLATGAFSFSTSPNCVIDISSLS
jgi:hypothetical protein